MIVCNYIINLDRRTDRWEAISKVINSTCLKNDNFIRFSAFDGKNFNEELKKFNLESHPIINKLKEKNIEIYGGLLGCFLSHVSVLQKIIDNTDINSSDYVGIYEDDFLISGSINNFNDNYTNFKKIDLNELEVDFLYLGGRFKPNFMCLDETVFEQTDNINIFFRKNGKRAEDYDRTAAAYVVKKSCCKKIIDLISNNFIKSCKNNSYSIIAIDGVYPNLHKHIKMFDYFPHFYYTHRDFESDVQGGINKINKMKLV
jgi:glycosyl transferase family 25